MAGAVIGDPDLLKSLFSGRQNYLFHGTDRMGDFLSIADEPCVGMKIKGHIPLIQ